MKTRTLLLFLSFLSLSLCSFGQDTSVDADTVPVVRKNALKFLPVNLAFNSISFEYERKINQRRSLVLGVGFPSSKAFPKWYNFDSPEDNISDDLLSTMFIRLDLRKYHGDHHQIKGFYGSPYLKYQTINASATNMVNPDQGASYTENIEANINSFNLGYQMGYQWLIAKRVTIDFYFLGFELGIANVDATVTSPNGQEIDEIYENVQDQINELPPFLSDKITVSKQGNNQVVVKGSTLPYPWLRSGLSIGIAF